MGTTDYLCIPLPCMPVNPFPKPIENVALSAKWNVHIWNRLWKCSSRLYTGTLKTPGLQRSNFRRLKIQLKLTWRPFAIGAIFKIPQSHREMCAGMPPAARRPTYSVNSVNLVLLDLLSSRLWFTPLGSDNSHFFKWLSRKWQSPWSVTQNLSRSWRRAIWCSRTIASVSGCHLLSYATIPHCRFTRLSKIEESATRQAMRPSAISPPSWRVTSQFLLIVLIYQVMKPTYNVCPSHAIIYRRLATSASPTLDIFSTKFSLKLILLGGNVSILSHDICRLIRDHDPAHTIHYLWLSLPFRFQARYFFRSYLLIPASELSGDRWVHSY